MSNGGFEYTVVRNDTLWIIARRYRVTGGWRTIWDHANNETLRNTRGNPDRLQVGDRVYIPGARGNTAPAASGAAPVFTIPPPYRIFAEGGRSRPSAIMVKGGTLRLKAVHNDGAAGTWYWSTASPKLTLTNQTTVTVTITAGNRTSASAGAEVVRVSFTPDGGLAQPSIPHNLSIIAVVFSPARLQRYGFDGMAANSATGATPAGQYPHLSVKKNDQTSVLVTIQGGARANDVHFVSNDTSIAEPMISGTPPAQFTLRVRGKAQDKAETFIKVCAGSATGPECGRLYVNVYKEKTCTAYVYKVQDSHSATSRLQFPNFDLEVAEAAINGYWKPSVGTATLEGSAGATDVRYDLDQNGKLTLEPNQTTAEERKISTACNHAGQKIIVVKGLVRMAYLQTAAARGANSITLKPVYGGYVAEKMRVGGTFNLCDAKGENGEEIEVSSVAGTTITLASALTRNHGTTHGILREILGLSGNPIFVAEAGLTERVIRETYGHELGHSIMGWLDLSAIKNLMYHSAGNTDTEIRYKPQAREFDAGSENQWQTVRRT